MRKLIKLRWCSPLVEPTQSCKMRMAFVITLIQAARQMLSSPLLAVIKAATTAEVPKMK